MAEVDTSSYPRPAAMPVQKSPLEIAGQLQTMERGNVALSAEKLNLINTQFQLMNNELANLAADPSATKQTAAQRLSAFANTYKFPPEVTQHMLGELNAAPDVKTFATLAIRRGMDNITKINQTFNQPAAQSDQANTYLGTQTPAMMPGGGTFNPQQTIPLQPPPTTPIQGARGQPGIVGAPPPGIRPYGGAMPVQGAPPPAPVPLPRARMPVAGPPPVTGPTGETVNKGSEFNNRFSAAFPNVMVTGPEPGTAASIAAVTEQSGKDLAEDLRRNKTLQVDLQPDLAVLDIVKGKGPTDFGPGTDALNQAKKLVATWIPGVDPKILAEGTDYDTVKKYLVQGARAAGNTSTNDQLAAAFEGNPNTTMSTATIENIVKSRVALRKMQAALPLLALNSGVSEADYSKWFAKNQNILDPRAFGFDLMNNDAREKFLKTMAEKDKSGNWIAKKGKEKEYRRFENSLGLAIDADLISPPGRQ